MDRSIIADRPSIVYYRRRWAQGRSLDGSIDGRHNPMESYYTPEEVAQRLRVTRRTVYEWLTSGRLRGYRAGSRWRIRAEDVGEFLRPPGQEPGARETSVPTSTDAQARAARIRAGRGILANASVTVDDLIRWKREEVERENRQFEEPAR
jgi:excisionase family DNA binding protein